MENHLSMQDVDSLQNLPHPGSNFGPFEWLISFCKLIEES